MKSAHHYVRRYFMDAWPVIKAHHILLNTIDAWVGRLKRMGDHASCYEIIQKGAQYPIRVVPTSLLDLLSWMPRVISRHSWHQELRLVWTHSASYSRPFLVRRKMRLIIRISFRPVQQFVPNRPQIFISKDPANIFSIQSSYLSFPRVVESSP